MTISCYECCVLGWYSTRWLPSMTAIIIIMTIYEQMSIDKHQFRIFNGNLKCSFEPLLETMCSIQSHVLPLFILSMSLFRNDYPINRVAFFSIEHVFFVAAKVVVCYFWVSANCSHLSRGFTCVVYTSLMATIKF